jgi:cytochrome P450
MDPPEHTLHRRMMNPAFTSAYLAAYLPLVHLVIADRARDWAERDDVELLAESREIAFDVAAVALVGLRTGAPADRLRELFYGLLHGFDASEGSWEDYEKRQAQMVADLNGLLLPIIAARRAVANEQPRDVLGMIVQARDDDGQPLGDEQILAHVKILLVAGHETTTSLAAWALYQLATRPADRARVHAEIDATGVAADEPLHGEALRSLRFLDAFVKETGRLYPPVLQVPRGVLRDVEFAGYVIPAGSRARLSLSACHRLPTIFADPARFDPGRFDPPREEDKKTPYALVTFGGGPRVCIGMGFAQQEVKALVAHALRRYHLDPVPGRVPVHVGYWTAFAPDGIHVRARMR